MDHVFHFEPGFIRTICMEEGFLTLTVRNDWDKDWYQCSDRQKKRNQDNIETFNGIGKLKQIR